MVLSFDDVIQHFVSATQNSSSCRLSAGVLCRRFSFLAVVTIHHGTTRFSAAVTDTKAATTAAAL